MLSKKILSILIVDDDVLILEILRERLEAEGIEVFTHNQPMGTSNIVLGKRPDVVLLDVSMPGLSGAVLSQLPALKNTPIIYHSSKPTDELALLVRETGVLGAIQKTNNHITFMRELRMLLRRLA